jgi:glycosyltransferase involved in cell wall biosynthesis
MKILLITSKRLTGLNYHRQIVPFENLLEINVDPQPEWKNDFTDEYLRSFDIVSFLRIISEKGETEVICKRLKKLGVKIHFDIDDYWVLPKTHQLYKAYIDNNIPQQTIEAIKLSDVVTTTTKYLAEEISKLNENVYILPNAINPNEKQWQINKVENNRLRFGYIAGVHHVHDAMILTSQVNKLFYDKYSRDKYQICVAGFNIIKDGEKMWMNKYYEFIEQLMTNNLKNIRNPEYLDYLKRQMPSHNEFTHGEEYRRLWGRDCFNYGVLYNEIDVSLVPLAETMFSRNKSELKLIEAGFMKKAVIVSDVKPYDLLATKDNSVMIKPMRNGIDWYTTMRKMIREPNMVSDLSEQLYEDVKVKYHIDTVNVERKQILESCV